VTGPFGGRKLQWGLWRRGPALAAILTATLAGPSHPHPTLGLPLLLAHGKVASGSSWL
jgi:hypothetical protein